MISVANSVLDITRSEEKQFAFNVVNPKKTSWNTIFDNICAALAKNGRGNTEMVPADMWLKEIAAQPHTKANEIVSFAFSYRTLL